MSFTKNPFNRNLTKFGVSVANDPNSNDNPPNTLSGQTPAPDPTIVDPNAANTPASEPTININTNDTDNENKKGGKRSKSNKRKSYKRKSHKRKSHKRESHKRKSYKRKSNRSVKRR